MTTKKYGHRQRPNSGEDAENALKKIRGKTMKEMAAGEPSTAQAENLRKPDKRKGEITNRGKRAYKSTRASTPMTKDAATHIRKTQRALRKIIKSAPRSRRPGERDRKRNLSTEDENRGAKNSPALGRASG